MIILKKKTAKKLPVIDMGMQSQSYCLSRLAQEQHLVELSHNRQRGTMRSILSCPVHRTSTVKLYSAQNINQHYCDNNRRKKSTIMKNMFCINSFCLFRFKKHLIFFFVFCSCFLKIVFVSNFVTY